MSFSPISEIIDDIRHGRMVIIVDDEDRENEGDLVMAAACARPEDINFMARYGRGLICLTLTQERCQRLRLPLMVAGSQDKHATNFTVSIEAARGVTTGISAADRATTIRAAAAVDAKPEDVVQPGHVFPLMAQAGGVIELYGERHRFVPVLAAANGWKVGEIEVLHHARQYGRSKYGLTRLVKGFLDLLTIYLLTGFSSRPTHLIGGIGIFFFAVGGIGMTYLSSRWVISRMSSAIDDLHLHETAIFYYCILALLLGSQFLLTGLLAELIVSRTAKDHKSYSIAEHLQPADGKDCWRDHG